MTDVVLVYCTKCRDFFDVFPDELAAYQCPTCKTRTEKPSSGLRPLDKAFKELSAQEERKKHGNTK